MSEGLARDTPRPRAAVDLLPPYIAGTKARDPFTAALASNESHLDPLPLVHEAVLSHLDVFNRYPDMSAAELIAAIAMKHSVSAAEIALGTGSVGVLQQLMQTMLDEGDEVIYAWRSFEAYPILIKLAGGQEVPVPLRPDDSHDLHRMIEFVGPRTKLIILCSPNNPTGVSISQTALYDFLSRVPSHVLVVLDLAYIEFVTSNDPLDEDALYQRFPNVALLRTFSKAHGLAGLRIGYAVARPEIVAGLRKSALPFGVTDIAQAAALASLRAEPDVMLRVTEIVHERVFLENRLRLQGWVLPASDGNFVWLRMNDRTRLAALTHFANAHILTRGYDGDGIRITVTDRPASLRIIDALRPIAPARTQQSL